MSTKQDIAMSALDIFKIHQETFEDAKKKSSSENSKRASYLRFSKDGTYTIRILPLAPVVDADGNVTLPRKGYEYPTKELLLKIEDPKKDAKGKTKTHYVSVCNVKYAFPNVPADLIDTYVATVCDLYADDKALCDKIKSGGFNGGLKYDSKRCMYVYDMDKRSDGMQILQISYAQYKELEERKLGLWAKLLSKNSSAPCPISSIDAAYAVEIIRKTDKKTEYSVNIDTVSDIDILTESEMQALLDAPRLPEVLYRYTRFHLEATIAFLKQMDDKFDIDVMSQPAIQDCIDAIKLALPAEDQSHFTLGGDDTAKNANTTSALDALWNEWEAIDGAGEDDKSDQGRALRVSIKEYIEDNELDIAITRTKTNYDLLNEIESVMSNSNPQPETKEEDDSAKPVQEEDEDIENDAPAADPTPQRQRNDDTNEPAVRPERRSSHPQRRR